MANGIVPFGFNDVFGKDFLDFVRDGFDDERPAVFPAALRSRKDGEDLLFDFDVPGLDAGDIEVSLDHGVLTVSGKHEEKDADGGVVSSRYVRRSVSLPEGSDFEKISASLDKGVLTVRVPVSGEISSARKIEIESK